MEKVIQVADILKEAGYQISEGAEAVSRAIGFDFSKGRLCSGFKIFPDGTRCSGCSDCSAVNADSKCEAFLAKEGA